MLNEFKTRTLYINLYYTKIISKIAGKIMMMIKVHLPSFKSSEFRYYNGGGGYKVTKYLKYILNYIT